MKAQTMKGVNGLHLASATGNRDFVRHLIEDYDFDVNQTTGESKSKPIHLAATGGHL